jgi:hypothetical protein
LRELPFRPCVLRIHDDEWIKKVEIVFHDGAVSEAYPPWGDPEHIAASWYAGYGGDQWRMMMEHEISHALLSDLLGQPHSFSVWSHAHGTGQPGKKMSQRVLDEEHIVTSFQRWINTGQWDGYDKLSKIPDIGEAADQFLQLARPWLWN